MFPELWPQRTGTESNHKLTHPIFLSCLGKKLQFKHLKCRQLLVAQLKAENGAAAEDWNPWVDIIF